LGTALACQPTTLLSHPTLSSLVSILRHSRGAADDISDDDVRDAAGSDFVE